MLCSSPAWSRIRSWMGDYDRIQSAAVFMIYIQIGCSLLGSIGALYNGVLLIDLAVSLFALVAVESSSQRLGRTYAVLLACEILLDVSWFILFFREIWDMSADKYGAFDIFSLRVALWMEIIGFSVRFLSTFVWIQMYRMGASCVDTAYREPDFDVRTSFLNCADYPNIRQNSDNCDAVAGSIYDPPYYSSLFEDAQDGGHAHGGPKQSTLDDGGSTSMSESSKLKSGIGGSIQVISVSDTVTVLRQSSIPSHESQSW